MVKETRIISAFPACGKSYFHKNYHEYTTIDSDSFKFHWEQDWVKHGIKKVNPEWPMNYINHIKENIGKVDYIFVSSHKLVRDLLEEHNIPFTVVVPYVRETCKYEWIGRMYARGNDKEFIDNVVNNWDKWLTDINVESDAVVHLAENNFIVDIVKEHLCHLKDLPVATVPENI